MRRACAPAPMAARWPSRRRSETEKAVGRVWAQRALIAGFAAFGLLGAALVADRLNPPPLQRAGWHATVVQDAQGRMLRAFLAEDGRWRFPAAADAVDPRFLELLIAYEDQRFAAHPGVDPLAAARAAWQLLREMRVVSGASTLTMQTARLLEPGPRGVLTKLRQSLRALQLEARFSKDEILALYLTLAPYGGNLEGVRAGALAWFGKDPRALTLGEAALLVGLPQAPERLRPDRHAAAAATARNKVLNVLVARGALTALEAEEARSEPLPAARRNFPVRAPHLAERVAAAGPKGGVVRTTLDGDLQEAAERLAAHEAQFFADGADVAVVVVENATRNVLVSVGNHDFWGRAGAIDLTQRARSPGSALKPFIYGLAFDDLALHPETQIDDLPIRFGDWAPRNFDRDFQGVVTVRAALQMSLNVPAVAVLDRLGPVRLWGAMRNAGAGVVFPRKGVAPSLPLALGGAGVTLTDLTMLYVALANGGEARPLRLRPGDPDGPASRIMSAEAAWQVRDVLQGSPLPDGLALGQGLQRPRAVAFKTGTSYGFRDAWSFGYSNRYTVGVWVGRADGSARPGLYARIQAAPILFKVFDLLPAEAPDAAPAPAGVLVVQRTDELPAPLRRFRTRSEMAVAARVTPPPQVAFPRDGTTVALPPAGEPQDIGLKATGGQGPLTWLVNGAVVAQTEPAATAFWMPDGEGFATITVVDAEGRSAQSRVRFRR